MDTTFKKTLFVIVVLLAVLAAIGFILPATAHVERSINLKANTKLVFSYVNNIRVFRHWSPWIEDPNSIHVFEGPEAGVKAKITWTGKRSGRGQAIITAVDPGKQVDLKLNFYEEGGANTKLIVTPNGEHAQLTWAFDMDLGWNIYKRYIAFFYMEGFIGPQLEKGLNNLKSIVEKSSGAQTPAP